MSFQSTHAQLLLCNINEITHLPQLLLCNINEITHLPQLLLCNINEITHLPQSLLCNVNEITHLPNYPCVCNVIEINYQLVLFSGANIWYKKSDFQTKAPDTHYKGTLTRGSLFDYRLIIGK
jgi:hypothetical protein